MSWLGKIKGSLDMVNVCVAALETISAIVKSKKDKASALDLVAAIVDRVQAGWQGTMKPEDIRAELEKMRDDLTGNRESADAAADAKYGPKP